MNFRINFTKFIDMLLPPFFRKVIFREYLGASKKVLENQHLEFVSIVEDAKYEMSFSPQTELLEQRLNEQFGLSGQILVRNLSTGRPSIFIGRHNRDNYRVNIGTHQNGRYLFFISRHNQYDNTLYDFEVIVPDSLLATIGTDGVNVIAAISVNYTPFGKNFRIISDSNILLYPL